MALTSKNALKDMTTPLLLKLAGVVACAFLIAPSADAVDALKTCACLLKGCRYIVESVHLDDIELAFALNSMGRDLFLIEESVHLDEA